MKRIPLKEVAITGFLLTSVLMCEGTNVSIAQSTDYLKEIQNVNEVQLYQLAMLDKKEVKKEIKVEDEWYIPEIPLEY